MITSNTSTVISTNKKFKNIGFAKKFPYTNTKINLSN